MRKYIWFMLMLLAFTLASPAQAQGPQDKIPPKVIVMHTEFVEGDELDVRVFFSVRDEFGKPVPPNQIAAAGLELNGQEPIQGQLEASETPIKIALVMDASGSMSPHIADVRIAANKAIDQAPEFAEFAVFTFSDMNSDQPYLPGLPFTSDKESVKQFIKEQYAPISGGNTCLYTAVYKATEFLDQNLSGAERRAVIAFTDGKDTGAGPDGRCSDRSMEEAIGLANPSDGTLTPLFMVGFCTGGACGNVDKTVLDTMAEKTNAIAAYGDRGKIAGAFFTIIDDIKNQKAFQIFISPCGENSGILHVSVLGLGGEVQGVVPLRTDKCYGPGATAEIDEFLEGDNKYTFKLNMENKSPVALDRIFLRVLSPNNTSVYTETLQKSIAAKKDASYPAEISTQKFNVPGQYRLQVFAEAADGTRFQNKSDPKKASEVLVEQQFSHIPGEAVLVKIVAPPKVDFENQVLSIDEIDVTDTRNLLKGQEKFIRYKVRIIDDDIPIYESDFEDFDLEKPSISIPLMSLPPRINAQPVAKKYQITVRIFAPTLGDKDGASEAVAFEFPVQERPGFFSKYGPYLLGLLGLIVGGAVGMYVWRNWIPRRKRAIPMPFNPATSRVEKVPVEAHNPPSKPGFAAAVAPPPVAQARSEPRLRIKVTQTPDPSQKREQVITYFPCVIGRGETNFSIGGDSSISRKHAEVSMQGDEFFITDLGSANGLFIDDNRQEANKPIRLNGRTVVRVGQFTYLELEPKVGQPAMAR